MRRSDTGIRTRVDLGMAASPEYSTRHRLMAHEERRHRWKGRQNRTGHVDS